MRSFITIPFIAVSCFLFACNNSEEDGIHLSSTYDSLAQGQNDTAANQNDQDATKQDNNSNSDAHPNDKASEQSSDGEDCRPIENIEPLFISDLGNYYAPIERENHDYTVSRESWSKIIRSSDEAVEFVQLYKLNNMVSDKLLAVDYNNYIIDAVYIGFRGVCGHRFGISHDCGNHSVQLDVISAPSMDEAISHTVVFVQLPAQNEDVNIVINDKELPFEEYYTSPSLPEY